MFSLFVAPWQKVSAPRSACWRASQRGIRIGVRDQSKYTRSDFANQPFTATYEPGKPTNGPLGDIPLLGRMGPTPKMLKHHLDQFVVGQDRAKKVMSTAVFNHYQRILELRRREEEEQALLQQRLRRERARQKHPVEDEYPGHHESATSQDPAEGLEESYLQDSTPLSLEKSNILLIGPSGVGKTLMARTLARVLEVPFSMSDCTPFTQAGYIGEDVQLCVERLLAAADYDVEAAEYGIIVLDEVDKIAAQKTMQGRDVGGEGVQQALLKIIEGTTLQIQVKPGTNSGALRGGVGFDNMNAGGGLLGGKYASNVSAGPNLGGVGPQSKIETFTVRTDNILFILTGAFIGLHKHVLSRIQKGSIGFGSQIKSSSLSETGYGGTLLSLRPDSPQAKFFEQHLPFLKNEPSGAEKKYNSLDLVEPADLQTYGMIPELVGRIPVTTALLELDQNDLVRVLTEPRNNLIKQYEQLFRLSGIELKFTSEALQEIAKTASKMSTGARALRTSVERLLGEAMFEAPGSSIKHVLITGAVARREQPPIYLARGQQHKFQSMIANEEEAFTTLSRGSDKSLDSDPTPKARNFEEYRAQSTAVGHT